MLNTKDPQDNFKCLAFYTLEDAKLKLEEIVQTYGTENTKELILKNGYRKMAELGGGSFYISYFLQFPLQDEGFFSFEITACKLELTNNHLLTTQLN